jgi:hypothetical protein
MQLAGVVVRYDGVPEPVRDPVFGTFAGFIPTDDGALVVGEPDVAATWYPVNDHPSDAASYTFDITVPEGECGVAAAVDRRCRMRRRPVTLAAPNDFCTKSKCSVSALVVGQPHCGL